MTPKEAGAAYFGSVFLSGREGRREEAEAAAAAEAAWRAGVVVDSTRFAFHATRDGTRGERAQGLLRGPPLKGALRVVGEGRAGGQRSHPGSGSAVPPLRAPPLSQLVGEGGEAFPGPSLGLEAYLRLPHAAGGAAAAAEPPSLVREREGERGMAWGGESLRRAREDFVAPGGRDFVPTAEPHVVVGAAGRVHVPLLEAGRRTNALPGVRNWEYLVPHKVGVNTDPGLEG